MPPPSGSVIEGAEEKQGLASSLEYVFGKDCLSKEWFILSLLASWEIGLEKCSLQWVYYRRSHWIQRYPLFSHIRNHQ